jgi:hypothetical protein
MAETFLILLAGGIMLAAAISNPHAVILRWLRLAGILALSMAGLAGFFVARQDARELVVLVPPIGLILAQLAFVQMAWRRTQRILAALAFACAIAAAVMLLYHSGRPGYALLPIACALIAATSGLALMDMLLGHAYLNAADMTMSPFLRLNRALGMTLIIHALLSIGGTFLMQRLHPIQMFWSLNLVLIATRWLVGFGVAGAFVYMAHDCIKRRATQSATGILYVAGVLIFIGEIIGLWVMSQTGRPV